MKDEIVFAGDSFTWGEGLELFIDNEKWTKQREFHSEWPELEPLQDKESIEFREQHRYPSIVGDELNINPLVFPGNGGDFSQHLKLIDPIEDVSNIKHIFVQLSQVNRNFPHLTQECRCNLCLKTGWSPIGQIIYPISENRITPEVKFIMEVFNCETIDHDFLGKFLQYVRWINRYVTELFIEKCKEWEDKIAPIHFIDSWSDSDSMYWANYPYIRDRMIDLVTKDGIKTKKWKRFVQSFSCPYINDVYPKTGNAHPTPELHQYLARSVITHIKQW